jgi:hypothetical protein
MFPLHDVPVVGAAAGAGVDEGALAAEVVVAGAGAAAVVVDLAAVVVAAAEVVDDLAAVVVAAAVVVVDLAAVVDWAEADSARSTSSATATWESFIMSRRCTGER